MKTYLMTLTLLLSAPVLGASFIAIHPISTHFSTPMTLLSPSKTALASSVVAVPPSVDWQVRKAQDNDVLEVYGWFERKGAFDLSLSGNPLSKLKPKIGQTLASILPDLPNGNVLFVEPAEGEVTGFCSYNLKYSGFGPPMLWMDDIYVDQTKRSRGAGQALMEALVDVAQSFSCTHMAWKVDERNERGMQFYDRIGAEITQKDGTLYRVEWIPSEWIE
jgi:GNAT superfamily N-acetyltransferase